MKKGNTCGQHSSSLVLNKGIELQHALHILQETIVLGMFTGSLCAQNWQVQCVMVDGHTRDIAQHICANFIWGALFQNSIEHNVNKVIMHLLVLDHNEFQSIRQKSVYTDMTISLTEKYCRLWIKRFYLHKREFYRRVIAMLWSMHYHPYRLCAQSSYEKNAPQ